MAGPGGGGRGCELGPEAEGRLWPATVSGGWELPQLGASVVADLSMHGCACWCWVP